VYLLPFHYDLTDRLTQLVRV